MFGDRLKLEWSPENSSSELHKYLSLYPWKRPPQQEDFHPEPQEQPHKVIAFAGIARSDKDVSQAATPPQALRAAKYVEGPKDPSPVISFTCSLLILQSKIKPKKPCAYDSTLSPFYLTLFGALVLLWVFSVNPEKWSKKYSLSRCILLTHHRPRS